MLLNTKLIWSFYFGDGYISQFCTSYYYYYHDFRTFQTSSIAPPSSVNSPQFVGGVYAGAYIQQAMPQVSASVSNHGKLGKKTDC